MGSHTGAEWRDPQVTGGGENPVSWEELLRRRSAADSLTFAHYGQDSLDLPFLLKHFSSFKQI
jgi:hypothetical protein